MTDDIPVWHVVKRSDLHGTGVFAACDIPANTVIFEYYGTRISQEEADEMPSADPDDPFHTFFFSLSNGQIIDGGNNGNDARWINHSCAPNCEAQEDENGERVYIVALKDIPAGQELLYDYGLVIDDVITDTLKQQYRCLCGAPNCRGTMLALAEDEANDQDDGEPDDESDWEYDDENYDDLTPDDDWKPDHWDPDDDYGRS